jgi:hypothetical protein
VPFRVDTFLRAYEGGWERAGPRFRGGSARAVPLTVGTIELLILKILSLGNLCGYGVLQCVQQISEGQLVIQQGSYPLHYSIRSARIGSTEAARRAGSREAVVPTASSTQTAPAASAGL